MKKFITKITKIQSNKELLQIWELPKEYEEKIEQFMKIEDIKEPNVLIVDVSDDMTEKKFGEMYQDFHNKNLTPPTGIKDL